MSSQKSNNELRAMIFTYTSHYIEANSPIQKDINHTIVLHKAPYQSSVHFAIHCVINYLSNDIRRYLSSNEIAYNKDSKLKEHI